MQGMTLKSAAKKEFMDAAKAYSDAINSGDSAAIIATSLRIHVARGRTGVPKKWNSLIGKIFKKTVRL